MAHPITVLTDLRQGAETIDWWKKKKKKREGQKDRAINPSSFSLFHRSCVLSTSPNARVINEDILQE